MTFYEAKTKQDFKRVVQFILAQPEFSAPRLCVNPILRKKTANYVQKILTEGVMLGASVKMRGWHLFYVEDKALKVRAIIFIRRKPIPYPTTHDFVLQSGYCVVESGDYDKNDGTYFAELCLGMAKHFGKGGIGEFRVYGNFLGWVRDVFKPHTQIKKHEVIRNWTTGDPMETNIVVLTWDHLL